MTLLRPNADGIGYNYLDEGTVGRLRELPVGGPATRDRRVVVEHNEALYMIGTYYESAEDPGAFQAILESFRFD